MKLTTIALLAAGGYYLYSQKNSAGKEPAKVATPPSETPAAYLPPEENGVFLPGGGMYYNVALPGDVIIELDGLGSCCANCARGLRCTGC